MNAFHAAMLGLLVFVIAWNVARAYVMACVDPHWRLESWLGQLLEPKFRPVGTPIWFGLWLIWPVVAWRYCKDNPQEKAERSFALW